MAKLCRCNVYTREVSQNKNIYVMRLKENMDFFIDANQRFSPSLKEPLPLFHMTNQWSTLELILERGLMAQYCTELISSEERAIRAAFPMISCSNLNIDEAKRDLRSYGTLGIALSQSWGQRNNFNPVLYLDRHSYLTMDFIKSFESISERKKREINSCIQGVLIGDRNLFVKMMMKFFSHTKNYEGELIRQGSVVESRYQFGLEREWRKVIQHEDVQFFLSGDELKNKNSYNQKISAHLCDFKLSEIEYIVIETNDEKERAKEILKKKYSVATIPDELFKLNEARCRPDEG